MAFYLEIEPEWNIIKKIREAIESDEVIKRQGTDFLEAARITAIELVENALKYSDPASNDPVKFSFLVDFTDTDCLIKVTNPCGDPERVETINRTLAEIQNGNAFELYVKRLEALRDHPDGYSRMGLYRIAYEAEFKMRVEFNKSSVTIIASRALQN
jgi:hypothetical protein